MAPPGGWEASQVFRQQPPVLVDPVGPVATEVQAVPAVRSPTLSLKEPGRWTPAYPWQEGPADLAKAVGMEPIHRQAPPLEAEPGGAPDQAEQAAPVAP